MGISIIVTNMVVNGGLDTEVWQLVGTSLTISAGDQIRLGSSTAMTVAMMVLAETLTDAVNTETLGLNTAEFYRVVSALRHPRLTGRAGYTCSGGPTRTHRQGSASGPKSLSGLPQQCGG